MDEMICNDCGWEGMMTELIAQGKDGCDLCCPKCKSDNIDSIEIEE